jgi:hypothetical protein
MGVWSTGIYSGDFAADLRAAIGAVARLPFDPDRLVEMLADSEPAARDPGDEDYTTFWLVVADQFAKRGLACDRVRDTALHIIDGGEDTRRLETLGMRGADLRKRCKLLEEVRARIIAPPATRQRKVLRAPQPLLMHVGDVMVYPTSAGQCINPYFPSRQPGWTQDGWAAMTIIDRGRAFEYLAWYRAVRLAEATREKPSLDFLRGDLHWRLGTPGTCSPAHFRKIELEKIGAFPVDPVKLDRLFPGLKPGISAAVNDISIVNSMSASGRGSRSTVTGIGQILLEQPG